MKYNSSAVPSHFLPRELSSSTPELAFIPPAWFYSGVSVSSSSVTDRDFFPLRICRPVRLTNAEAAGRYSRNSFQAWASVSLHQKDASIIRSKQ